MKEISFFFTWLFYIKLSILFFKVSETFKDAGLHIDKCLYSYIYILQPLRSCAIKKSRKTLIFIGPTQRTVTVDSCAECVIVTVCRRIIIRYIRFKIFFFTFCDFVPFSNLKLILNISIFACPLELEISIESFANKLKLKLTQRNYLT